LRVGGLPVKQLQDINSEIVEKPQTGYFVARKYLILLHTKLNKMPKWGFFNSLSSYQERRF
jgi:hypothetical protein